MRVLEMSLVFFAVDSGWEHTKVKESILLDRFLITSQKLFFVLFSSVRQIPCSVIYSLTQNPFLCTSETGASQCCCGKVYT